VKHPQDATSTSKELYRQAEVRLGHRCGSRFRSIVLRCLNGDFSNPATADEAIPASGLQSSFRELVVNPLRRLSLEV
jgi:hypothetical protein